jgi:uncharacterized protein (DUF427 family)
MNLRSTLTGHTVDVHASEHHVRVLAGGQLVAETTRPLVLHETGLPDRFYIPREDVGAEFLEPSDTTSHCPFKGDASYVSVRAGEAYVQDAAWAYDKPKDDVAVIAGHLSFYPDRVQVEVDGQPLT